MLKRIHAAPGNLVTLESVYRVAPDNQDLLEELTKGYVGYAFALLECPSDTDANIKAAFTSFAGKRTAISAGFCALASRTTGAAFRRPAGWPIASRLSDVQPHIDPAPAGASPTTSAGGAAPPSAPPAGRPRDFPSP